jgi:RNA polymerase-binding transcription factor
MPSHDPLAKRLPKLRRALVERRRMLRARVRRDENDLRRLGSNVEPEEADEAHEDAEARLLIALDDRGRREVATIDAALARMEDGRYGRCAACEKPIPIARLEALPETPTCRGCAEGRDAEAVT